MKVTTANDSVVTKNYAIYNADSCELLPELPDESIGLCIHSPPFASLYSYSDSEKDLGNCKDYDEFFVHYGFIAKQLQRIMQPGRVVAVHCMDLPVHKNKEGFIGLRDFSGDIIRLFEKHKFIFHSRYCIWKDPLTAATRTHALGLAHKQIVKDSSMCRTGIPDYVLAFRKEGENTLPIEHPMGLLDYAGENKVPKNLDSYIGHVDQNTNKRSHWIWQQYASPVWMDIRQERVLSHKGGRDQEDERHICPLQRDVIERCLVLWSNPKEIVLSPFAGVGSEIYDAVRLGRFGIGIELKKSYFKMMKTNLETLKVKQESRRGFDL